MIAGDSEHPNESKSDNATHLLSSTGHAEIFDKYPSKETKVNENPRIVSTTSSSVMIRLNLVEPSSYSSTESETEGKVDVSYSPWIDQDIVDDSPPHYSEHLTACFLSFWD